MKIALPVDILTVQGSLLTLEASNLLNCELVQAKKESIAAGKYFIIFHDNDYCYEVTMWDFEILSEARDMVAYDAWEDRMRK